MFRFFAATGGDGPNQQLGLRSMDSLTIQPLAGTNGAIYPFWSPDSRNLGFFADQKLKKTEISSGTVQILCDAGDGRGASWSRDDVIVFAPKPLGALFEISAAGGTPVQVTSVNATEKWMTHRLPHFLPDGKRLLFYSGGLSNGKENGIFSLDLQTKNVALVARENSEGFYVEPGYLVFVRNGNLMAQPFDVDQLRVTGQAVPIAERILYNTDRYTGGYSLSDTGLLVFDNNSNVKAQLTWFDLEGKKLGTVGEPTGLITVSISPNGGRALIVAQAEDGHLSLWMYDLNRGIPSRFTVSPGEFGSPAWSSDGRLVVYVAGGVYNFFLQDSGVLPKRKSCRQSRLLAFPAVGLQTDSCSFLRLKPLKAGTSGSSRWAATRNPTHSWRPR
jgi:Tol biopolymer transport system component